MPSVFAAPRLFDFDFSGDGGQVAAVLQLCAVAHAPADRPLLGNAVNGALAALDAVWPFLGSAATPVREFAAQLRSAAPELKHVDAAAHHLLMAGRWRSHRAWGILTKVSASTPAPVLRALGAELARCLMLEIPFRPGVAKRCGDVLGDKPGSKQVGEAGAQAYADRLLAEASRTAVAMRTPGAREELLIAARVISSLAEQLAPRDMSARTAAGGLRHMTEAEVLAGMRALRRLVGEGDPLAIAVADAYFAGLAFDVALDVPFEHAVQGEWAAVQDVQGGLIKIDLATLFPQLAKPKPGHVPASLVLVRPYPAALAIAKQKLIATNVKARCLRDLLADKTVTSRQSVPGMSSDALIAPSISRLLASRGTTALAAGLDRTVGAYLTVKFSLIGAAKASYATISRAEIWAAAVRYFLYLGWGEPVQDHPGLGLAVGSMVTPTEEAVQRIDSAHLERLAAIRIGRRYTQNRLLEYHNAYAVVCTHRTALFTSSRRAAVFHFTADAFSGHAIFAAFGDKRVGRLGGFMPIPMPRVLQEQLALWRAHLRALARRVKKLGWSEDHPVFQRCEAIERGQKVALFFTVTEDDIQDIGTSDLMVSVPEGVEVNGDVFRHFIPNELRRLGVPSHLVDAAQRHQVELTSRSSASANVVQLEWLGEVARKLDEIAIRLGLLPVKGLSGNSRNDG